MLWADDEDQLLCYPIHQALLGRKDGLFGCSADRLFLTDIESFEIFRSGLKSTKPENNPRSKATNQEQNPLLAAQIIGVLQQFASNQIVEFGLVTEDDPTEIIGLALKHIVFHDKVLYLSDDYGFKAHQRRNRLPENLDRPTPLLVPAGAQTEAESFYKKI